MSLRITVSQTAKSGHRPVHEALVEEARKRGLAGATVLRSEAGSHAEGEGARPRKAPLSEGLPLLVEIVDLPERIGAFLRDMYEQGLLAQGRIAVRKVPRVCPGARVHARRRLVGLSI
ncbi:MAG TPA: DUF190 domain-containing protein [Planctomycetota bacterium]|nr:DUF190 domain-containing protein [Planctomycetota bacterium]HRR81453.1 DUF190 domain-containing protein [Planctomycetota bacterium]